MNPIYLLLILPIFLLPLLALYIGEQRTVSLSLLSAFALLGLVAIDNTETPHAADPRYTLTDLGFLPGGWISVANDINDRGEIVGYSDAEDCKDHPFLYKNGKMYDLGIPKNASGGTATRINSHGAIAGDYIYEDARFEHHKAFRYRDGKVEELPMPTDAFSSYAKGIDNAGQIVGIIYFNGGRDRSIIWKPDGEIVQIPGLGESGNGALDINSRGRIVGYAKPRQHGYIADSHGIERIGDLGGGISIARSINARSQVAGLSWISAGLSHAFLYQAGKMRDLGTLYGRKDEASRANAISASGDVLGVDTERIEEDEYRKRAFLWREGRMIDLNGCTDAKGWEILSAAAENNQGQIVATGKIGGKYHAVLLTPQ